MKQNHMIITCILIGLKVSPFSWYVGWIYFGEFFWSVGVGCGWRTQALGNSSSKGSVVQGELFQAVQSSEGDTGRWLSEWTTASTVSRQCLLQGKHSLSPSYMCVWYRRLGGSGSNSILLPQEVNKNLLRFGELKWFHLHETISTTTTTWWRWPL